MLAAMVRNEGRMREVIDGGKGSSRFRKNRPGVEEVGGYDALERGRGRGEGEKGGGGGGSRYSSQMVRTGSGAGLLGHGARFKLWHRFPC